MTGGEKSNVKSQRDRFIETARALGADEDEAAFKEKLAVIARQRPKLKAADQWQVYTAKVGAGYTAHPVSGQVGQTWPIFASEQEVRDCLAKNGYVASFDDPDIWGPK